MTAVWKDIDPNAAEAQLRAFNRRLLDLDTALEEQKECLRIKPHSFAFGLAVESLLSMQQRLADERIQLLAHRVAEKVDVALDEGAFHGNTASVASLGVFLIRLQGLYSSIAQALAEGPKRRGPISKRIGAATELRLASTFASSFGMSLVVEAAHDRDLLEATVPGAALEQMFSMLDRVDDPLAMRETSGQLGARPINHLRHLAGLLSRTDAELRLEWSDSAGIRHYWEADPERARNAVEHLSAIQEARVETKVVKGKLVGASLLKNTFELLGEDHVAITGRIASSVLPNVAYFFGESCFAVIDETAVRDSLSNEVTTYRSLIELKRQ